MFFCFHARRSHRTHLVQNPHPDSLDWFEGPSETGWILPSKLDHLPSGKRLHNYGKSQFLMGKLTINGHVQ